MHRITSLILFCSAAHVLHAAPVHFQSSNRQTALLELYTSEGCSSCPPAETWLSRLRGEPGLWRDFVPVAFHVDYWDHLGWRDPFGGAKFSARQRAWADEWKSHAVYTPGFVLAGREWRGWFKHAMPPNSTARAVGRLTARSEDFKNWTLRFEPATPISRARFQLALLGFDLASDIRAGENRGRKLRHDFVVLDFAGAAAREAAGGYEASLALKPLPASTNRLALAAWVAEADAMTPQQCLGGWLPGPP